MDLWIGNIRRVTIPSETQQTILDIPQQCNLGNVFVFFNLQNIKKKAKRWLKVD